MARGWESKSVEDQIAATEAERELRERAEASAEERERSDHKKSLTLSRALIIGRLQAARNERYRTQLKKALGQIDLQIAELE